MTSVRPPEPEHFPRPSDTEPREGSVGLGCLWLPIVGMVCFTAAWIVERLIEAGAFQ